MAAIANQGIRRDFIDKAAIRKIVAEQNRQLGSEGNVFPPCDVGGTHGLPNPAD